MTPFHHVFDQSRLILYGATEDDVARARRTGWLGDPAENCRVPVQLEENGTNELYFAGRPIGLWLMRGSRAAMASKLERLGDNRAHAYLYKYAGYLARRISSHMSRKNKSVLILNVSFDDHFGSNGNVERCVISEMQSEFTPYCCGTTIKMIRTSDHIIFVRGAASDVEGLCHRIAEQITESEYLERCGNAGS